MPLILILAGAVLMVVAFRGTEHEFAAQAAHDFGGTAFLAWSAAVVILGAIGYYSPLRRVSDLGLALVILALVLANGGLFTQLAAVIDNPPAASAPVPLASYGGSLSGSSSSSSGGGGGGGLACAGEGAASGAAMGSVAGPWGTVVGAGVGAIAGGLG